MILEVSDYKYSINHKINCFVNALIYALENKNITITPVEAMLYTQAVNFRAMIDFEENGVPTLEIIPVELDFFNKFAEASNIRLDHYSALDRDADIKLISDAIRENTCVTAVSDQFQIGFAISEVYKKLFPDDLRMPHHFITIHAIEPESGRMLFSEPSFSLRKHDHWIEYDVLEKARKSKWYQLEINKDLYIVKDVSGFSLPDAAETFKKQISLLIEQIRDSLAVMNEFFEKYIYGHDDKKLIETNYSGIVTACSMFDQGGYVYRDYLYKEASQYIKDKRVVSAYKALEKKWHPLTKNIRKKCDKSNMSYDEYCELFGMLKEQVNYELETHIEVINMLQ